MRVVGLQGRSRGVRVGVCGEEQWLGIGVDSVMIRIRLGIVDFYALLLYHD